MISSFSFNPKQLSRVFPTDRNSGAHTLPDTSLCAIVRDEIVNPEGGIVDFGDSTVPFVEKAVILDTGSVDGTYETLLGLSELYPHLHVFQHGFEGYGPSRNRALKKIDTELVLVLDADERLTEDDFRTL